MIKYIGSKRLLVDPILAVVSAAGVPTGGWVIDPFSGSARVGYALKGAGFRVVSGDLHRYAATVAGCYVGAGPELLPAVESALARLRRAPPRDGWFTQTYCEEARFFTPENGRKIEGIRAAIDEEAPEGPLRDCLLTALMEAADRVDSTVGLQMAYLKSWAPRALAPLDLRAPALIRGEGVAQRSDATALLRQDDRAELVYLDPPYNQHKYLSNYHIWETLVAWDQPEVYGVARKRVDCRTTKSPWNSKRAAEGALHELVTAIRAPMALLSLSDEAFLSRDQVCATMLRRPGSALVCVSLPHRRHVGSKIGIFSPAGERVGVEGPSQNQERLYLSGPLERVRLAQERLRDRFSAELILR